MRRVLGIAGWSGAGKTTLLVDLVTSLREQSLAVAVVKHDGHGLDAGDARRDSERLFAAGAEVVAVGPGEALARWRVDVDDGLAARLAELERRCDLVLVEGWKRAPHPKVWLARAGDEPSPPPDVPEVVAALAWDADRATVVRELARRRLDEAWRAAPVRAGLLVGGRARRMGTPKEGLVVGGETLLARARRAFSGVASLTLLGASAAPSTETEGIASLSDAPGVRGPLAGLLAALRWSPQPWLIAACDLPRLRADAVAWLLAERAPGRWAVLPRVDGVVQPLLAVYEPQALSMLEALALDAAPVGPSRLASRPHVATPEPPRTLADAWRGINTPEELAALS